MRTIAHVMAIKSNEKLWALTDRRDRCQVRADRLACSQVEESAWSAVQRRATAPRDPGVYDWAAW